jgi:oligopeptide/dipeptide ABC transporter ATP-binding protein
MSEVLLSVKDLKVHFPVAKAGFFAQRQVVHAVDGASFEIPRSKTLGLVGESGSGKSTTGLAILRLVKPTSGQITFDGRTLNDMAPEEFRAVRRRMQVVFQDPYSSLDPRSTAGEIVRFPLDIHTLGSNAERKERVAEVFSLVGLRPRQMDLFPHQFSGGQRQRISIARALVLQPEFIVCDEPVSALDVAIQAQILNLLTRLRDELNLTLLFISHDLGVISHICDEVAVMYLGKVVEKAPRYSLFKQPLHPYTQALLSAVPARNPELKGAVKRIRLLGDIPSPINPPSGCRFHTRCPIAQARCRSEEPQLTGHAADHLVACHFAGQDISASR